MTTTRPFHLAHLNVLCTDLERSLAFYRDVFGATYLFNLGPTKVVTDIGGFEFFLEEASGFEVHPLFHFGFRTTRDGVYQFAQHLERLGIPMVPGNNPQPGPTVGPDGERVALYLRDPDGWLIEVYAPERAAIDAGVLDRDPRWALADQPEGA